MKLKSRGAAVAVSATLIFGGAVIAATPASAVGSSACDYRPAYNPEGKVNPNVNFRNGPSTSYTALGVLTKGTRFQPKCSAKRHVWFYGKVLSGSHRGQWGWVNGNYLFST